MKKSRSTNPGRHAFQYRPAPRHRSTVGLSFSHSALRRSSGTVIQRDTYRSVGPRPQTKIRHARNWSPHARIPERTLIVHLAIDPDGWDRRGERGASLPELYCRRFLSQLEGRDRFFQPPRCRDDLLHRRYRIPGCAGRLLGEYADLFHQIGDLLRILGFFLGGR